ncbi:MAG: adenylate/guanylate cyclase domain-containing protein [Actinomycetota bacterium]
MRFPRTFIFVDLSGFTNYTETNGDRRATKLLGEFRAVARAVASERGVRIDKYLGDGLMAVAVEQVDGITFALELERRAQTVCAPLTLRIGIDTGDTILFEGDDYIGSAPNLAARLCDEAADTGVLIPTDHIEQLPEGVSAEPYRPLKLHGFTKSIEVSVLSGHPVIDDRNDTSEIWTRQPFLN